MRSSNDIVHDVLSALRAGDNDALAALQAEVGALPPLPRRQVRQAWAALVNDSWRRWRDAALDMAMRRWAEDMR